MPVPLRLEHLPPPPCDRCGPQPLWQTGGRYGRSGGGGVDVGSTRHPLPLVVGACRLLVCLPHYFFRWSSAPRPPSEWNRPSGVGPPEVCPLPNPCPVPPYTPHATPTQDGRSVVANAVWHKEGSGRRTAPGSSAGGGSRGRVRHRTSPTCWSAWRRMLARCVTQSIGRAPPPGGGPAAARRRGVPAHHPIASALAPPWKGGLHIRGIVRFSRGHTPAARPCTLRGSTADSLPGDTSWVAARPTPTRHSLMAVPR